MEKKLKFYMFFIYITQLSITFFPLLIKDIGLQDVALGFVLAIPFIFTLFFSSLWGKIADKLLGLKRTLCISLLFSAILFVFCGIFRGTISVLIVYTLCQFVLLPLLPLSDAFCVGNSYGKIRLWGTIGLIIACVVGGALAQIHRSLPYLLCSGGCVLAFFFLLSVQNPSRQFSTSKSTGYLKKIFSNHRLVVLYILAIAVNSAVSVQGAFFSIYFVNELGFPSSLLGIQAALRILMEIPFLFFASKFDQKFGIKKLIAFSLIITGIRMVIIGLVKNLTVILLTVALFGASYIIIQYYLVKVGNEVAEQYHAKSRIQSLNNIFSNFPRITGTVFGSMLVQSFGYNAVSLWAGIFICVCFFLFILDKKF